jgi:hypothetical protein
MLTMTKAKAGCTPPTTAEERHPSTAQGLLVVKRGFGRFRAVSGRLRRFQAVRAG